MDRVLEHLYVHGVPSTESAVFHDWQEMNMRDRTPFYPVEPNMTFGVEYFGGDGPCDAHAGYIDALSNVPDIGEDDGYMYRGDRYSRCDYDYARA
ncbi:hypothetical protein EBT31_11315, partial [bacterium]|nr:hypothetical protein [bacterium]